MTQLSQARLSIGERALLEQRRRVHSFFIAEVDRDKIPLSTRE